MIHAQTLQPLTVHNLVWLPWSCSLADYPCRLHYRLPIICHIWYSNLQAVFYYCTDRTSLHTHFRTVVKFSFKVRIMQVGHCMCSVGLIIDHLYKCQYQLLSSHYTLCDNISIFIPIFCLNTCRYCLPVFSYNSLYLLGGSHRLHDCPIAISVLW